MRVLIVGAGAVGGFLASVFHEAGHTVSVVARGPHLHAIQKNGLRVITPDGRDSVAHLAASDDPQALGAQDIIITTLKAPALPGVLPMLGDVLTTKVPLITAMNGVFWWYADGMHQAPDTLRLDPDGQIAEQLSGKTSLGMVVHSTNEVIEPGVVQNRSPGNRFVVGGPSAASVVGIREMLSQLTLPNTVIEVVEDVRPVMWRKLLRNLTTAPISVVTSAQAFDVINDDQARNVARALFLEGAAVAGAHGFSGLADEVVDVFSPGKGAKQKPSMSQDIDKGRPLEIDSILRVVQDFARQMDIPTPTLDTVLGLVILRARIAGCY
ncbi:MAG: ketopantoate reductase family protein [Granulosicoccus sp.]